MDGVIFDIKRYALHDGPGIRTTVFLKGCPMKCLWCHNPESQSPCIEKMKKVNKIGSQEFVDSVDIGYYISPKELIKEIEKDIIFFEESGGGVTFSGGEPLMQDEFLLETLKLCKQKGIHTCVDTCGYAPKDAYRNISEYTDIFLYDIKHMDSSLHQSQTGVGNEMVLNNLELLSNMGKNIIVRYPLIPEFNISEKNINKTIEFIKQLTNISAIHLLPYHNLGKEKYVDIGRVNPLIDKPDMMKDEADKVAAIFLKEGLKCKVV